jgi:hypothetical protein
MCLDSQKVGQPGEFANMTGDELEAWIVSEDKRLQDKRLSLLSRDAPTYEKLHRIEHGARNENLLVFEPLPNFSTT